MAGKPYESLPQQELLYRLRAAIDTAVQYPSPKNVERAVRLAVEHPRGMRSSHVSHNLGVRRWEWLAANGVTIVGESVEIADSPAFKATITPEVRK